tara:strand:- start:500 stop:751 length:252 start_codon:yes stop_codon:yes gene_type:complete
MYNYRYKLNLKEADPGRAQFQEKRMRDFQEIEARLNNLYPILDNAKDETANYYKENPESYSVVYGTDLVLDLIKDIEQLLKGK